MSNYYDFPVPSSSSSSHNHTHTHTPPNPKSSSSTTRARDISRLLDPLYAPSSSSYSARIPSCAPTAVYVDHYGNVHDPDYRPFPPPPLSHSHSHSHSHSRAPALTRAASGFVRPRWETGFEDSPIDGEEYGDDDDDDELEGSEYGNDYTPIPRRASTPPSQFQTQSHSQSQQAQHRLTHRDCDSRLNHRDGDSRLNHRDSISTYRSSTPYTTTTTTFADSSPPTSYESEQTYLTHPDEPDDTPFVRGCGDDPFVRVRADDDLRNHRGGKDDTQTITTTKCVVHTKTKKRHTHTTRAHPHPAKEERERKSRLRGLPKEKAHEFLNEKSPSSPSPYPSPYSPSSYYDDSPSQYNPTSYPRSHSPRDGYVPTHHHHHPSSDSTSEIWTPTCGQALKREWQAISLRLRFGVFRAQRKVRRRMGGT